jgi:hypothetical protein
MERLRIMSEYSKMKEGKTEVSPEGFLLSKRPFQFEWDIKEEKK